LINNRLPVVGLTGAIGAGKSTAASFFADFGAKIINADEVGKYIINNYTSVSEKIRATFGNEYFDHNGNLKRKKLGELVFSDTKQLKKLNNILHPLMLEHIVKQVKKYKYSDKFKMIIVDAAIIFELNQQKKFDYIITVSSNIKECMKRSVKKYQISEKNFYDRLNSQIDPEEKIKLSDFVIKNDSTLDNLKFNVKVIFDKILDIK